MLKRWLIYLASVLFGLALVGTLLVAFVFALLYPTLPTLEALTDYQPKIPLRILSAEGDLLGEFGEERRALVKIKDVPDVMREAILAAEDERFYQHGGVDYISVLRAALSNAAGGSQQGAGTITMQVARNFFLTRERTLTRKLREVLLAYKIEANLSKDQILELYVNQISAKVSADEAAQRTTGDAAARAQSLADELSATHKALDAANLSASDARNEASAKSAALAQATSDLDAAKAQLASNKKDYDGIVASLGAQLAASKSSQADENAEINKSAAAEKEKASERIFTLESELVKKTTEADGLATRLSVAEDALKNAGDSGAKIQALTTEVSRLKGDLETTSIQLVEAGKKADAAKADLASANAELAQASKNSDAAKADSDSRITALQADLAKRSSDSEALSAKLAVDEAALKSAGDSGAQAQAAAANLSKAKADLATANAQLADAAKSADAAKANSAARIASLQSDLSKRSSDADALSAKLAADETALRSAADSGAKLQELASELAQAKGDLASANTQLAEAAKSADAAKADSASRIASLQADLAKHSSDSDALSAKLAADESALKAAGDIPAGAALEFKPRCIVERGAPEDTILRVAAWHDADMIVLGARSAQVHPVAITHFSHSIVYKVVTGATCPVLTVRE